MAQEKWKRQGDNNNGDNGNGNGNGYDGYNGYNGYGYGYGGGDGQLGWWWTPSGIATRYAIVAVFLALLLFFFVGGYCLAQRRLRKGLPPRRWNGWMVPRTARGYPPRDVRYAHYGDPNNQGYMMDNYPPPPPAYNNAEGPPPIYQPPPGASKAMADQNFHETNRGEASGSARP